MASTIEDVQAWLVNYFPLKANYRENVLEATKGEPTDEPALSFMIHYDRVEDKIYAWKKKSDGIGAWGNLGGGSSMATETIDTNGVVDCVSNTVYEITDVIVKDSTFVLPTIATTTTLKTGDKIEFIVTGVFTDTDTFAITGSINGSTDTVVINNRQWVTYSFHYSKTADTWVLQTNLSGY